MSNFILRNLDYPHIIFDNETNEFICEFCGLRHYVVDRALINVVVNLFIDRHKDCKS